MLSLSLYSSYKVSNEVQKFVSTLAKNFIIQNVVLNFPANLSKIEVEVL